MLAKRNDTLVKTERLFIAPPKKLDYADWAELRSSSADHLLPWEPTWPQQAHSKADWTRRLKVWSQGWKDGRSFVFLMRRISDGEMIGGISLTNVRGWPAQSGHVGYWLGGEAEGNGFMREGVAGVCKWAFDVLDLTRVEAGTLPENDRSRRVLESVGFLEEGYAKSYLEIAGERRDHILYGLVRPVQRG